MKKLNADDVIKRFRVVHGDKYDYSKFVYNGTTTKSTIICPKHGEFEQMPKFHLMGRGCPVCGREMIGIKNGKNIDDFITKAKQIHGDKYDYSKVEYTGCYNKVIIICPEHGEFLQSPRDHLQGCGCPKCGEAIRHVKKIDRDVSQLPKIRNINNKKYTTETFIEEAKKVHGDKYDYSKTEYTKVTEKVCIICPEHGEFMQQANFHLQGRGCPKCGGSKKITPEDFIEKAKQIHGDRYDYSKVEYIDYKTPVIIICKTHGPFKIRPDYFLAGHGCRKCKMSHLEREMMSFLDENKINYIYQYEEDWLDRLSLDFYLTDYNTAIECQGLQHFKPSNFGSKTISNEDFLKYVIKNDKRKKRLCEEQGVTLLYYSNLHIDYPYEVIEDKQLLLERIQQGTTQ